MASWQTHAVCVYLRVTRKKRYRTTEAGLRSMADGIPAAPLPDELRDRTSVAPLAGGEVVTVGPADGIVAGAGALVYLHGGAFVNGIQPQHWSLIGHLVDSTHRPVHVARYVVREDSTPLPWPVLHREGRFTLYAIPRA